MSNTELLRQQLSQKILFLDGAMGTMIQGYKLEEKDGCFGPDNTYQLTWYFDKSNLGVNKYIFHDAKDDDIMYLFDTTSKNQIRDLKRSQSVVIYRKATDTVVGSGSLTVSGLLK